MNKTHKLVWSASREAWIVTHEAAKSFGKPSSTRRALGISVLAVALTNAWAAPPASNALPTGGQIVAGAGAISQAANSMTVQQNTAKMIANWQSFNIGSAAAVNFVQPSASAVALNRVMSADPSQIYGSLTANGQVFLINPNGVIFGQSARVDVAGLTVSTFNLSNDDFLSGRYSFSGGGFGGVTNLGQLAAREGGFVALVAPTIQNAGSITAQGGQVAMAAGSGAKLEIGASGLISVAVDASAAAKIQNSGLVAADGGKVILTANRTGDALGAAINQSGVVRANTLNSRNGEIWLDGGQGETSVAGKILAQGPSSGDKGGKIVVTGDKVSLAAGSELNASGQAGGGQVFVGGGWQGKDAAIREAKTVIQEQGSSIRADATGNGDGGTAVLWSVDTTRVSGAVSARGAGAGKGGQIETSSHKDLGVASTAVIDAGASSGRGGRWLLDPTDVTVVSGSGTATSNTFYADTISATLGSNTDVTVQTTDGDITVNAAISKIAGAGAATLTFDAATVTAGRGNITVNQAISASSGVLNLVFGTASNNLGVTTINAPLSTNGGTVDFYKNTTLAHASPISTKPSGTTSQAAGYVKFWQDLNLAAPGYSVTINTQGAESGGAYTSKGGDVTVLGSISSAKPASVGWSPQALIIDTSSNNTYHSGAIQLGDSASDVIGKATDVGITSNTNSTGPLRSLTLAGPTTIDLYASQLNFAKTSGDVIKASTIENGSPTIVLHAPNTTFSLVGGVVAGQADGYTDLVQDTFNVAVASGNTDRTLTYVSDRSVKVKNYGISGSNNAGKLDVTFKPYNAVGANGGAIIMDNASIVTNGGFISLGNLSSTGYATGFASDSGGVYDGVNLKNVVLTTNGGKIDIAGKTTADSATSAGVKITGASTQITSTNGDINITGIVQGQTSGNKDGVILGEGGASRITVETTGGNLTVTGDASGVINPSGGSRYDGVIISSAALLKTGSGDISITGKGGGGDQAFVSENHGIRFEDTDTSVVSATGNIVLRGTSGGKTTISAGSNSFGIYAKGANMYIGRDANRSSATGDISFVADSMNFENSSATHMRVATAGELLIKPESTSANIDFGTAGALPVSVGGVKTLTLGNTWFNGSAVGVFQAGPVVTVTRVNGSEQQLSIEGNGGGNFTLSNGSVTTGPIAFSATPATLQANIQSALNSAGMATSSVTVNADGTFKVIFSGSQANALYANAIDGGFKDITIGRSDSTGRMTVSGATTFRDNLYLQMGTPDPVSYGGLSAIAINAPLTVKQQPNNSTGRTLTLDVGGQGVTGTAAITVDKLLLTGVGDFVLSGSNLVSTLAASINGNLDFTNAQDLSIGQVSTNRFTTNSPLTTPTTTVVSTAGIHNTDGSSATGKDVRINLTGGNLTIDEDVKAGAGTVALVATAGKVEESGSPQATAPIVTAAKLYVNAATGARLDNKNVIANTLAASVASGSLEVLNTQGLDLDRVTVTTRTAAADGSIATSASNKDGVSAPQVVLRTLAGDLTQQANGAITTGKLGVYTDNGKVALDNTANQIDVLAVTSATSGQTVSVKNKGGMSVGQVSGITSQLLPAGTTITGVTTNAADINVAASQGTCISNCDLVIDQAINAGNGAAAPVSGTTVRLASGQGAVREAASTGVVVADKLLVQASNTTNSNPNASSLTNDNAVNILAAQMTGSANQDLVFKNTRSLEVGAITDAAGSTVNGVTATSGNVSLMLSNGDLTQTQAIIAAGLKAALDSGQVDLSLLTNDVDTLSASLLGTGKNFTFNDLDGLTVGTVNGLIGISTTNGGSIAVAAGGAGSDNALKITQNVTAGGNGTVDLRSYGNTLTSDIAINNGSKVSSASGGTVQLAAGHAITVGTATDGVADIDTTGSVLLIAQASGIGSNSNRLEIGNAATLAGKSGDSMYLRKLGSTSDLAIDTVSALTFNGASTFSAGLTIGSASGLTTTANNGGVTLTTQGGDLTIKEAVTANGSGAVDIRTASSGNGGDVVIANATGVAGDQGLLKSTSGTVQVIAGGGFTTTSGSGSAEIDTAGNVLIEAGKMIGADTQRIEITNAATLAARTLAIGSSSDIWLRKLGGASGSGTNNVTIGRVTGINTGSSTDNTIADGLDGLVTTANNAAIALNVTNGNLTVSKDVVANGNGTVDLRTKAGNVAINGATIKSGSTGAGTGTVQVISSGDITTDTVNGSGVNEIATAGNVLLSAGGGIGAAGNRIETAGVNTLAAESAGAQWLRQTSGALTIGSVTALTPTDNAVDIAVSNKDGLVTTAGDAAIALNVTSGNLTVSKDVVANGNGTVDLRTKAGNVAINGATLKSGSAGTGTGTVQVVSSGAITTNTLNGSGVDEIATAGNVLLSAGGAIGADGSRIEMAGVNTLAAQSAGEQWLRQTSGSLTVGSVAALAPSDNTIDIAASSKEGLVTTVGNAAIALNVTNGNLTVSKDVVANGNGTVDLRTKAGNVAINGATIKSGSTGAGTGTVQVVSSGDITTNTVNGSGVNEIATAGNVLLSAGGVIGAAGNRIETAGVNTLAAESVGAQWLRQTSGALTIGSVTALTPTDNAVDIAVSNKDGLVTTAGDAAIALNVTSGNLTVSKDVVANGNGTVDLRTKAGNVAINGATLKSGSAGTGTGTVQVVSSGDITTNTVNGSGVNEIATAGNVLLSAGGAIGGDGNRIEMAGVNTLAAQSAGSQWLRQTSGELTVGSVTALVPSDNAGDIGAANQAGLVSTAGNVTLTTAANTLTIKNDVVVSGSNNIDLRAAGASSDIVIDGATVKAASGTAQLAASRNIVATSNAIPALQSGSAGKVLLQAGKSIGSASSSINTQVGTLAAKLIAPGAGDTVNLNQTATNLTVGSVAAVNATSTLDGSVANVAGVTSGGRDVTLATQGASSLTLASSVDAGAGTLVISAGQGVGGTGGVSQSGGALTAGKARIDAAGDASLMQAGNRVNVLASAVRNLEYFDAGKLVVDTVAGETGVTAGNRAWIRAQGQHDPLFPEKDALLINPGAFVVGLGNGPEAVVLVADGAFRNFNGAGGVVTPNSRWLIYDYNAVLEYRLGGIPHDWRQINATYESFPPSSIGSAGNIYITTAKHVDTEQYSAALNGTLGNTSGSGATLGVLGNSVAQGGGATSIPSGDALMPLQSAAADAALSSLGKAEISSMGKPIFPVAGLLTVQVAPGRFFETALADFTAGEPVGEAMQANGAPLPEWLRLDSALQRITGVMPMEQSSFPIRLRLRQANGTVGREVDVVLVSQR